MKFERMILIAFLGNYLVNNVVAGLASLVPPTADATNPMLTAQYFTFAILGAIALGLIAWWYLMRTRKDTALTQGVIFGVVGFLTTVATAFITGVSGVLLQTGSLAQVAAVLPNFGPYIVNATTLVLLGLWIVPSALVGWILQMRMKSPAPAQHQNPSPMI